ncbi:uncharacterized protein C11orf16 homolog [Anguilla anguilla]|uniref:uncharacterized protein C11orf16 homolog n=1 Tax=Anguilla anguilla TaxID=7936 RepID=UPI0015AB8F56|nr:uncharacterized protein C11orf16 homolog [Anguilla anguilla]
MPDLSPSTPGIFPLFLGTWDRNVTFIVDISEGMYPAIGSVKQWLVQTLLTKASLRDSLFNILGFSHKVTKWSEHMVTCSPDTVYEAMCWIHSLSCSPGRDLSGALTTAFSDPACQSVHLVTNGLPDDPEELLWFLPDMVGVRPVHVFYLSDTCCPDSRMQTFLQRLTQATRGSCHILSLSSTGAVEKVRPLYLAESRSSPTACSERKYCSAGAVLSRPLSCSLCAPLFLCPYRCSLGHLGGECPVSVCSRAWGSYSGPPAFLPGSRVLARRELDRFYYLGTVREELQGRRGVYLVEFDRPAVEAGSCETALQLTTALDLVPHTQAHGHSLVPGDKVLAPWEPSLARYGPGSVIQGVEIRDPLRGRNESGLHVLFWNGCQVRVPGEVAVWIPPSLHERILQELQRPLCYHGDAHGCLPWPRYALCPSLPCLDPPLPTRLAPPHHCPHKEWWCLSAVPPQTNGLTGTTLTSRREELERKVDAQLKELRGLRRAGSHSSSSSSSLSEDVDEEPKLAGVDAVSAAVNTDLSLLEKPKSASLDRPAWRYWGRSCAEPQHRQPERLMKNKNRSTKVLPPEAQIDSPTNHSSLFQLLPVTTGQRLTVKDVLHHSDSGSPLNGAVQFQLIVTGKSIPVTHT